MTNSFRHHQLTNMFSLSLLSFLSSFIFTLQVQRRRIGEQKHLTLHIPFVNLMYCRLLIYILAGVLLALRRLHLDVAALSGRGSPCIMGGARTFGWQGFPHGEKFFSILLTLQLLILTRHSFHIARVRGRAYIFV